MIALHSAAVMAAIASSMLLTGCLYQCRTSPTGLAIQNGDIAGLARLLDGGAQAGGSAMHCNNVGGEDNLTWAVEKGNAAAVKLLLERKAPLEFSYATTNGVPLTPLFHAAKMGRADIVRLLMEHGADVDKALMALAIHSSQGDPRAQAGERIIERLRAGKSSGSAAQPVAESRSAPPISSDIDKPVYRLAERENDFAIVVSIGKYSNIPEAQFGERDGEAVKDHLLALGFPSRNVVQLTGEKAGYKGIEKFVETWLPKNVDENSRIFFYFSGHGTPDIRDGRAYLLPFDGDPSFLENTGYPVKRLYEKLSALKAREVIVVLDACFSGAGGRSVLAKGARPLVTKAETVAVPQNLTVFAAASGDQITSTLEDQGHGTFTYYFLKGLSGAAKDASGRVTTKALYDYLKPKVQDAARRQNRDQEPVLHSQGDRELVRF